MTRLLSALALAIALTASAANTRAAEDPKLPDTKTFDKLVIDTLRDVHNKGADLYNTSKDFVGTYRMYQGALVTVRPLLAHRPEAQKLIDTGLITADKEPDVARKAFVLHETIEAVRKNLKTVITGPKSDTTKKPEDKKPEEKKKPDTTKKPDDKTPVAPMPKESKPKEVQPKDTKLAGVSGKVIVKGKPLAEGEVTFVSQNLKEPKVTTAKITDGSYKIPEALPPGKYGVLVTGDGVPAKYNLVGTSGLTVELKSGTQVIDLDLK